MKKLVIVAVFILTAHFTIAQPANYDVLAGTGNGYRFWGSDWYKVSAGGGADYTYGPVTDFSMKFSMSPVSAGAGYANRGWVWGEYGLTPVGALGATGNMKIAGTFNAQGISLDRSAWPYILFSENGVQGARVQGTGGMFAVTSINGASNWLTVNSSTGNVGVGTSSPASKLDMRGGYFNVVGYNLLDYTFIGRSADPGANDSYFFHRITANYHLLGSSKNGTGFQRGLGFSLGGSDSEADIKMTISPAGNVGIGTGSTPGPYKLAVVGATQAEESVLNLTNNSDQDLQVRLSAAGAATKRTIISPSTPGRLSLGVGLGEFLTVVSNGNVGIGSLNPNQKLTVNGTIYGKEVKVDLLVPGPDYVFLNTYSLRSLAEVEDYIKTNQHLPEVPSAAQMEKEGINLSEMNMLLLKKVEELTLYLIKLEKKVDALEKGNK